VSKDRVVFLSLHADSRHPTLRGLMAYVPGAVHRGGTYGESSATYRKFEEVREKPHVRFTRAERVRSEAVSRKAAAAFVRAFRNAKLPVQSYQPIRDTVIRGRERWLPAVLRGNTVPASVLLELLNLSNAEDASLLATAKARQRIAAALVDGLRGYFGEDPRTVASGGSAAGR
jgi:N-acetylmuramoyl-L-alanine amidase